MLSEDLIRALQQLIVLGRGDKGRLEYMLDLLQKGRILPDSDLKYLQIIMSLYLGRKDTESYVKNMESVIEKLHSDVQELNKRIASLETKGFEKYVGHKTILFFVTVFVGWNVFQGYLQYTLPNLFQNASINYVFPLNMLANYFNNSYAMWIMFVILLLAWPFIGGIHLTKFIRSRKISK